MKLRLIIASNDTDYVEHLSDYLSDRYADSFEVVVVSQQERFKELLKTSVFDISLIESSFTSISELNAIRMSLVLTDETDNISSTANTAANIKHIRKYQRISAIVGDVFETFAGVAPGASGFGGEHGCITVVWSPSGGVGKTAIALAYAAKSASAGKHTIYLNLENFASTSAYFRTEGKSISKAFESLDSKESNIRVLMMGLRQQDSATGIYYFNEPENYDDINILAPDDIEALTFACAVESDEIIIDLSSQYNACTSRLFELANNILIVADPSTTSQIKLRQFIRQHNAFGRIKTKTTLVNNKGAKTAESEIYKTVYLPYVQTSDHTAVFRALSGNSFE